MKTPLTSLGGLKRDLDDDGSFMSWPFVGNLALFFGG